MVLETTGGPEKTSSLHLTAAWLQEALSACKSYLAYYINPESVFLSPVLSESS
ncbi:MAG: hypothetical protein WBM37_07605 [Nitrososphaeraceae archaeon]